MVSRQMLKGEHCPLESKSLLLTQPLVQTPARLYGLQLLGTMAVASQTMRHTGSRQAITTRPLDPVTLSRPALAQGDVEHRVDKSPRSLNTVHTWGPQGLLRPPRPSEQVCEETGGAMRTEF